MVNNLVEIKQNLHSLHSKLLADVTKYGVEKEDFFDIDNWYTDSENLELSYVENKLILQGTNVSKKYLSFLEKNNNFKVKPNKPIYVTPSSKVRIKIDVNKSNDTHVNLVLIEYSNSSKLNVHYLKVNTISEISLSEDTKFIRIALKITLNGVCEITDFNYELINVENEKVQFFKVKQSAKVKVENLKTLKVACIFDEFTTTCYRELVDLITFTPENWQETLTNNMPDFLMVESAWRGNNGAWEYKIAKYNNQDQSQLLSLLKWCRVNNIPTVFWNKEDPIHFEKFIHTAKHFDYIYTTDQNMIPNYKKHAKHENVYALPFSAQPTLHNPIKLVDERDSNICFAGSYYANRHEARRKDMDEILDICLEHGLTIFDRNYEKNKLGPTGFSFPERFKTSIKGALKYNKIDTAYKGYKVMLNVNSVKNSPTMFSRRVFEGLACGTPIVSSYSEGIQKIFKDIVLISENKEVLESNLEQLMNNDRFYHKKSLLGIREVFLNHTYEHRLEFILNNMNIEYSVSAPSITCLVRVKSVNEIEKAIEIFENQSWSNKKLIFLLEKFDGYIDVINNYNNERYSTYLLSYLDNYDKISDFVTTDYLAYISLNHFYGENYLLDMLIATIYSNAPIITKENHYKLKNNKLFEVNTGADYKFVSNAHTHFSIIKCNVFDKDDVISVLELLVDNGDLTNYFSRGSQIFSVDKMNLVENITIPINDEIKKAEM